MIRNKKPKTKSLRKAVGQQIRYVKRNMQILERLLAMAGDTHSFSRKQQETLSTIRTLYEQQYSMYKNRNHQVEHRIVSIGQPHVCPIVRGKIKAAVEFGAKIAISIVKGYAHIGKLDWEAFNEGITLIESVERYRQRYGHYRRPYRQIKSTEIEKTTGIVKTEAYA